MAVADRFVFKIDCTNNQQPKVYTCVLCLDTLRENFNSKILSRSAKPQFFVLSCGYMQTDTCFSNILDSLWYQQMIHTTLKKLHFNSAVCLVSPLKIKKKTLLGIGFPKALHSKIAPYSRSLSGSHLKEQMVIFELTRSESEWSCYMLIPELFGSCR